MGVIMVIVLLSRGLMVPVYMSQLGLIGTMSDMSVKVLKNASFAIMIAALAIGAFIVLKAMIQGRREEKLRLASEALEHGKA
jgi:hypothetical protein